jgi:hypothetical protein
LKGNKTMFNNYNKTELLFLYNYIIKSKNNDVWYNEKKYNKQYILNKIKDKLK